MWMLNGTLNVTRCISGRILEDDFGEKSSDNSDPRFSARGTYVMKIPASAKSDSRARGSVVPFKQLTSLLNPDDYSDENAGTPPSSTEASSNSDTSTQITTLGMEDSWDLTTSNNEAYTSEQNGYLNVATTVASTRTKPRSSTKIGLKTSVTLRNNKRQKTKKTTRKPLGSQPLQQLMAFKSWLNHHENETMAQYQSEESSAINLVHSLLQSSKHEQDENVTLN